MKKIIFPILLLAVILSGTSCTNITDSSNIKTAVELVKIGGLYAGIDNPVKVVVSGIITSEISVSIDNGTISGEEGEYIIHPQELGTLSLIVSNNGTEIHKKTFQVLGVPEPIAGVLTSSRFIRGGSITKSELNESGGITAELPEWFLYDLDYKIVSFKLVITVGEFTRQEWSNSSAFTEEMIDLISSVPKDQIFYVADIIAVGPDGRERELSTMKFTISEF